MSRTHIRAPLLLEGTQEIFRARVRGTESYRTDSRVRLGTGAYRRYGPFPIPASPHFSQEGSYQRRDPSIYKYGFFFDCAILTKSFSQIGL